MISDHNPPGGAIFRGDFLSIYLLRSSNRPPTQHSGVMSIFIHNFSHNVEKSALIIDICQK